MQTASRIKRPREEFHSAKDGGILQAPIVRSQQNQSLSSTAPANTFASSPFGIILIPSQQPIHSFQSSTPEYADASVSNNPPEELFPSVFMHFFDPEMHTAPYYHQSSPFHQVTTPYYHQSNPFHQSPAPYQQQPYSIHEQNPTSNVDPHIFQDFNGISGNSQNEGNSLQRTSVQQNQPIGICGQQGSNIPLESDLMDQLQISSGSMDSIATSSESVAPKAVTGHPRGQLAGIHGQQPVAAHTYTVSRRGPYSLKNSGRLGGNGRERMEACPKEGCFKMVLSKNMKGHLMMHKEARMKFACRHCGAKCGRESDLRRHERKHSDPHFFCSECNASFTRNDKLQGHRKKEHGFGG